MSRNWKRVFVVYRIDYEKMFTIISVWDTMDEASKEAERLNDLNRHRGCEYHWQHAKKYEK